MTQIYTDKNFNMIRENPSNPRHPRSKKYLTFQRTARLGNLLQ